MNTIELIRAEIERRIKVLEYTKEQYERGEPDYDANGRMALDGLLSFLDTMEEQEVDDMTINEYCEKFVELYKQLQEEHGLLDNVTLQTCYDKKVRMAIEFIEK